MDDVMVTLVDSLGNHATWIRTNIRFGQPETTDELACGQLGQKTLFLLIASESVDRMHYQGTLDRQRGAVRRVHTFHLARYQTVGSVRCSSTTITIYERPQQTCLSHRFENTLVECLVA